MSYQAFVLSELMQEAPERMQALLKQLVGLFEQGVLEALPYVAYDVRHLPAALRHMAQGRHVGKQVVQLPRRLDADGDGADHGRRRRAGPGAGAAPGCMVTGCGTCC